jgi:hypothetical protein
MLYKNAMSIQENNNLLVQKRMIGTTIFESFQFSLVFLVDVEPHPKHFE